MIKTVSPVLVGILSLGLLGASPMVWAQTAPSFAPEEQASIFVYQQASPAVVTLGSRQGGSGSGTIISPEGLVLTNDHVVRGSGGQVSVFTASGEQYLAQVIATDPTNDLALVRINSSGRFPTVPLASPAGIQVGQKVYAIGSPFGLSGTFTTGILSRIAENGDLQTDAAINPGNSGGPLLNSRGELIGVNKAILSPSRGNIGIGFATSALIAQQFIAQNQNNTPALASQPQGPRLGVTVDTQTLVIQQVQPGSIAGSIGLRPGDQLVGLNGQRLVNLQQLLGYLDSRPASALLTVARGRRLAEIQIQF